MEVKSLMAVSLSLGSLCQQLGSSALSVILAPASPLWLCFSLTVHVLLDDGLPVDHRVDETPLLVEPFSEGVIPFRRLPLALEPIDGAIFITRRLRTYLCVAALAPRSVQHLEDVDKLGKDVDGRGI